MASRRPSTKHGPGHRSASTDADGSSRRTGEAADPPARHLVHRELVAVDRDPLALPRHPAELRQHQAAHGAHVLAAELVAQPALELGERHAALHPPAGLVELQHRRDLVGVVLVVDLADDLLEDVLEGDDPRGAAELVHHHGEVAGSALEVAELAVERLALGHERRRPDQGGPRPASVARPRCGQHVLGIQHAGHGVGMAVEDEEPRMLGAPAAVSSTWSRSVATSTRDDVDARRHDLGHGRLGQREDADQHLALEVSGAARWPPKPARTRRSTQATMRKSGWKTG